ncbi:MAG: class I SAM-dependent methyltransferase [Methanotrichaceae archaeon]|jgi:tRNA (cmo5U34)-methyltransferase
MDFPNYDKEIHSILPYYDSFHQETINLIESVNSKPAIWLDTGCGTGTLVETASKHFPDTKFVLADPSAEMLEVARKKLSGSDKVTFLKPNSTQDLSIEIIGRADVITAIQSHHYLSKEDRIKVTKVCYDILNEGGIYVTFENIRPLTKLGTKIGKRNWKIFQLWKGRDLETVENHLKRFDSMFFPITVEDHLSLLRVTGFKAVELLWYSCMQAGFYGVK